jgi:cystathionine gamma-synthase
LRSEDLSYHKGLTYTRADNPTYAQVSHLLAEMENGSSAQLFSSGMAATVAVFQTLKKGDHVILPNGVYGGTRNWANKYLENWDIQVSYIPDGDDSALSDILNKKKTQIVWIETPANPTWSITDINKFADLAHGAGALVVCDNTIATPILTKPLNLGADIVLHSATKYLNGHGDVLMGALITKTDNEFWSKIQRLAHDGGALPGSIEAWFRRNDFHSIGT